MSRATGSSGTAGNDDLDISSGGVVAVDTETLRSAAGGLRALAGVCEAVRATLDGAADAAAMSGVWIAMPTAAATDAGDRAARLARDLEAMAGLYDIVELQAQAQSAAVGGDLVLATKLHAQAVGLMAADPALAGALAGVSVRGALAGPLALNEQYRSMFATSADLGALAVLLSGAATVLGLGTLPRGTRLRGLDTRVHVTRLGPGAGGPVAPAAASAPAGLVQAVDRIPRGEARVRVERYTMPDGDRRFVAYIGGTVTTPDRAEAWDWASDLGLYARMNAASDDALAAALTDAGAAAGDTVDLFGHSQGAMNASYLALSGDYDVSLLVTFGDPVHADVGEDTLSVAVRHLDDPVAALAGGGSAAGVGADGSFVATREHPGTLRDGQGLIAPHELDAYRETAAMLDASEDPRMDAVRARLDDLGRARSVETIVYAAARDTVVPPTPYVRGEEVAVVPPPYAAAGGAFSAASAGGAG